MRKLCWMMVFLTLVLSLRGTLPVGAQGTVNLSIDDLQMDQFPATEVRVTVRDANGVPIVGLGPDRFEIVEDGRASFPPSELTMRANPDAVISVVMVIDISGSMKGKPIQEAIRAANALLDQLSAQDRVAIIAFADEVKSLDPNVLEEGKELGFTTDKNAIRNVLNFLDTKIGWDTPLYDAIYKGVKIMSTEPVGKRAVIVMTDGRDERDNAQGVPVKDAGSLSTPDDPINEANRHNIPIFPVGLVGLGGKIDTKYLQRLAERTGGIYQEAPQPEELTPLFQNVVNQLKTQYALAYESRLPQDDIFHSLMVRVTLPQGQDFDETKFQFVSDKPAPAEATPGAGESSATSAQSEPEQPVALQTSADVALPATETTPQPAPTGIEGFVETFRSAIQDRPILVVVIGTGVFLLTILLIALVVVLLRGRAVEEEEYPVVEFTEPYSPPPRAWGAGPTDAGVPVMGPAREDRTEPERGTEVSPFGPVPGSGWAGEIPVAGGTRIIERAPQHLAMLVDRTRPDRKFDLKGTTNVGRAQDNQVILDHPTVSRHHAWIRAEGEEFLIFDIGSANGTFVNDQRIEEPLRLQNGDTVRFGDVELLFTRLF